MGLLGIDTGRRQRWNRMSCFKSSSPRYYFFSTPREWGHVRLQDAIAKKTLLERGKPKQDMIQMKPTQSTENL